MPSVSFEDIRRAAEAKYGPFEIELDGETYSLLSPVRLPEKARAKLQTLLESDDQSDVEQRLKDAVKTAAKSPTDASKILAAVGDDLGLLVEVMTQYGKASQVGEASPSSS